MSRREFFHGVIATSALSTVIGIGTGSAVAAASLPSAAAPPAGVLTAEQSALLTRVLNHLIPAAAEMPAAGDIGVAQYIDRALLAAPHLRAHVIKVLAAIPESTRSGAEFDELLHLIEDEQDESFDVLVQAAYSGYYSDPHIHAILHWCDEQRQPPVAPFDESLLVPIHQRMAMRSM
jgi:hypothetical protein